LTEATTPFMVGGLTCKPPSTLTGLRPVKEGLGQFRRHPAVMMI
jgi:hypothetical protein